MGDGDGGDEADDNEQEIPLFAVVRVPGPSLLIRASMFDLQYTLRASGYGYANVLFRYCHSSTQDVLRKQQQQH